MTTELIARANERIRVLEAMVPKWLPISEAPFWDPASGKQPPQCITFSPDYGVRTGQAWRWIGTKDNGANIDWVSGNCSDIVTHFHPLPPPPEGA